jgi:Plant transposon protein
MEKCPVLSRQHCMLINIKSSMHHNNLLAFVSDDVEFDAILQMLLDDSSDEDEQQSYVASRSGRSPNKHRNREAGANKLHKDYFADEPLYSATDFRRRYRMQRTLFQRIHDTVLEKETFFQQKSDACGAIGFNSYQKMTAAIRMMAYGGSADSMDENLRMGESTIIQTLTIFTETIVKCFGDEYLRQPNQEDLERILKTNGSRGFVGMLGSLDCMHWRWKNCPKAFHGQYKGKEGCPTVVAEAVASYDLWFWHFFSVCRERTTTSMCSTGLHCFAR